MPSQAWQARRTSTSSGRRGRSPWPSSARRSLAPLLSPHTSSSSRSTRNPALDKQHGQPWASRTENTSPAPAARSLGAGAAGLTSRRASRSSPRCVLLLPAPYPAPHRQRLRPLAGATATRTSDEQHVGYGTVSGSLTLALRAELQRPARPGVPLHLGVRLFSLPHRPATSPAANSPSPALPPRAASTSPAGLQRTDR